MHGVSEDVVHFKELVRLYRHLDPALHVHVGDSEVIDFEALTYAMRRLPPSIASVYMLYLTDSMQEHLDAPSGHFKALKTPARRRVIYELMPGKVMVVLRDGVSDLLDLVSCLCAYSVEAKKLRLRVQRAQRLKRLAEHAEASPLSPAREDELLASLDFSPSERDGLVRLFGPGHLAEHLYAIALHHEDFNIQITKQRQGYNAVHAEAWTDQIAAATRELLGRSPEQLEQVDVHLISSNTHSVVNCLGTYLFERREAIEAWGAAHHPGLFETCFHHPTDRLFALARAWLKRFPEERLRRDEAERRGGIMRLKETALTGIQVELIDLARVDLSRIDPELAILVENEREDGGASGGQSGARSGLIVNIDYAFGQQAEEALSTLLALFGRQVKSVNVLGKAGGLCGERGDVLLATAFIEQTDEVLSELPGTNRCLLSALQRALPDRQVHVGPILTVAGTLLQNRVLLNFYKHIWGCVGLEMEGTSYLREINKAVHLGLIPASLATRFAYYVSDTPLQAGETLAGSMPPEEGVPPLYAITRHILSGLLADTTPACQPGALTPT